MVAIPLLAGLSIMHGTVPPHPAAMLAAAAYHADLGRTILFGLVIGVPAAIVGGPLLGWILARPGLARTPALAAAPSIADSAAPEGAAGNSPENNPEASKKSKKPAGPVLAAIAIFLLPVLLVMAVFMLRTSRRAEVL